MIRQALLLPAPGGHRFALWDRPEGRARAALLLLPPFAEELNKTRRACAQAAQAFVQAGFAVLRLDPLGCGDSSGDFGDADWSSWVKDLGLGLDFLEREAAGLPRIAWALRAGALLDAALRAEGHRFDGHLWWQPSPQGKAVLQQFLRLKLAATLDGPGRGSMAEFKAELAAGRALEVAGYRLSPGLAQGLEAAQLQAPSAPALWLEAGSQQPPVLLPASERLLADWPAVQALALNDPAPWAATELEDSPALTQASLAWLNRHWPAAA